MIRRRGLCFLLPLLLGMLAGCHVPLQPYRLQHPAIEVPPPALNDPPVLAKTPVKDCTDPESPICLAFIELDDMGEPFDKGEIDTALSVIRRANDAAAKSPGHGDPIVIAFVHGWKNNAAEDNGNVAGFQTALQEVYRSRRATNHVIGIYVGWRGNLINKAWPVAQQLSYYNREATATRIPGATLATALSQIAARTHENRNALAVFIGHSFGGLLLERAVTEMTASEIAQATIYAQEAKSFPDGSPEAQQKQYLADAATDVRADLVIFINPAGAATEARQMLDFLIDNGYRYRPNLASDATTASAPDSNLQDRPLIVSLTSTADLATKVAVPIGHEIPYLQFKANGSFRDLSDHPNGHYGLACYDPHKDPHHWELKTKAEGALPQGSYYMNTAPHMQILQSHVMLKAIGAKQMQAASTGEKIEIQNPKAIAECSAELFNEQKLNVISTFRLYDTQTCFAIQERPGRCNGSPYWLMELDPDVVPDHSTIFTQRFIQFLISTYFTMPRGQALQRVNPQLTTSN